MSTSNKPELVGLAGTFVGGKDTLAERMVDDFGFTHVSTGDMVREIAMAERGSVERPVLQEIADHYRKQMGAGALVLMALEKSRPLVVTGLRSLGEAKELKNAGGVLMWIDAPLEVRYQRMVNRHRDQESQVSLEEFKAREEREWHAGDTDADFNLEGIREMSDIKMENEMELDTFIAEAYKLLKLT